MNSKLITKEQKKILAPEFKKCEEFIRKIDLALKDAKQQKTISKLISLNK